MITSCQPVGGKLCFNSIALAAILAAIHQKKKKKTSDGEIMNVAGGSFGINQTVTGDNTAV